MTDRGGSRGQAPSPARKARQPRGSADPEKRSQQARTRLLAARVIAQGRWPYVSTLLFTLRLVETPPEDVPTMAVDTHWRLYYSVPFVLSCTAEQLATVVLHECQHVLLDHPGRFAALNQSPARHSLWNVAGDVVINEVLTNARMPWPKDRGIRYADLADRGVEPGMTTEAAYFALLRNPPAPPSAAEPGTAQQDGTATGQRAIGTPTPAPAAGSTVPPPRTPTPSDSPSAALSATADCGSGAGGPRRPYEAATDHPDHPSAPQAQQELVRGQVAQEAIRHASAQGDVPAELLRWAEGLLDPTVDWRRVLAGQIRRGVATAAGRQDFTFRFPSRRANALRASLGGAVLPAMRQPPPPRVAVVLDTSGSISGNDLRALLAEVLGIVRAIGLGSGLTVIPCDARAYDPVVVRRPADVGAAPLRGGGGTDMRAGIVAAQQLRPRPDVIVVQTDGFTPWPTDPPHPAVRVIVALTEHRAIDQLPDWADHVVIE